MVNPDLSVTALLEQHGRGEAGAFDRLVEQLYAHLRKLAHGQRVRRSPYARFEGTLATTALVNEAYLRLMDGQGGAWKSRGHFLAAAAQAMRHLLVDAARRRLADKRGGGMPAETLDERWAADRDHAEEVVAVHEALERLKELGGRLAPVVECRFFAGLTEEETAEALGVSSRTVHRDWLRARAWLKRELGPPAKSYS